MEEIWKDKLIKYGRNIDEILQKYRIEAKEGLVVDKEISGASSNQLSFPSLSPTSSSSMSWSSSLSPTSSSSMSGSSSSPQLIERRIHPQNKYIHQEYGLLFPKEVFNAKLFKMGGSKMTYFDSKGVTRVQPGSSS